MKFIPGKEIVNWIGQCLADPQLDPEAQLRKRWVWIWMLVTFVFVDITLSVPIFNFKLWPLWWFGAVFFTGYSIGFPLFRRNKQFDLVFNVLFTFFITVDIFAP